MATTSNCQSNKNKIEFPYLPDGREIEYVADSNEFMQAAQALAKESTCTKQKTGAVIVRDGKIIAQGSNTRGNEVEGCPRDVEGYTTGTGYELCKSECKQAGHAEVTAVEDGEKRGVDMKDADLYMAGHWWCCKPCWQAMTRAGIKHVYLAESSKEMAS